jgi:predicted component of type VI protein secretion system
MSFLNACDGPDGQRLGRLQPCESIMRPLKLTAIAFENRILTSRLTATFDSDGAGIGRAEGNALSLPDDHARVMEQHAVLHHDDGWHIENLGHAATMALNDRPLAAGERASVAAGDRIAVGPYTLLASEAPPSNWSLAPAAQTVMARGPLPEGSAASDPAALAATALPALLDLPADPLLLFAQQDNVHRNLLGGADDPMGMPGLEEFAAPAPVDRSGAARPDFSRAAAMDDGAMRYDSHFGALLPNLDESRAGAPQADRAAPVALSAAAAGSLPSDPAPDASRWIELARAFAAGGGWQAEQAPPPARLTPELMHTLGTLLRYLEFRMRG